VKPTTAFVAHPDRLGANQSLLLKGIVNFEL
jgi:hypothetical protein